MNHPVTILGIETSGPRAGAALARNGEQIAEEAVPGVQGHCEGLIPAVERLLHGAGVDRTHLSAVAVAVGPGSFTGLRVGIGTARGLALGLGIPNVAVPSVEAIAWPFRGKGTAVAVVLPSRREHVFCALLGWNPEARGFDRLIPESNLPVEEFLSRVDRPALFAGPGLPRVIPDLEAGAVEGATWDAASDGHAAGAVALIGEQRFRAGRAESADTLLPLYVHHDVATVPGGGSGA